MNDTTPIPGQRLEPAGDDRLEILRMVAEGTVTADEAARLLDALDQADRGRGTPAGVPPADPSRARHLRIRVSDSQSGKSRVNLVVPLNVVDAGISVARRLAPRRLVNAEAIRDAVMSGMRGPIVDIDENGERVEIIVE
ncbi:MAG: SHOCT-like domain-containing protein [Thermomicrobiales bacterium]